MNPPLLGYVLLYVNDVAASLAFYEKAFGLAKRFFHDDNGKAYGELETGATRLAFASLALAREHLKQEIVAAAPDKPPLGVEIALTTPDVPALFKRAVTAGAMPLPVGRLNCSCKAFKDIVCKRWLWSVCHDESSCKSIIDSGVI